ncbi:MAG: hypothetical protein GX456_01730 [Verrucomicrobia bacterium]|nr:hypothetical protein [Verrucomicrobiota bacterium]
MGVGRREALGVRQLAAALFLMREQRVWHSIYISTDAFGAPGTALPTIDEILRKAGRALRAHRKQSACHPIAEAGAAASHEAAVGLRAG